MRFSYDGFGNLTGETATKGTGFTTTYNHDANNHLIGGYSYDANGNLTSLPGLTLTYDIENRLTQAVHTTNGTDLYVYNPWNERVWAQKSGNGLDVLYIYGPDGRLAASQVLEIDSSWVLRMTNVGQELYLAGKTLRSDALGGEVIEDRIGTAKAKGYYPYGELKAGATATQFATYRRGASGLDYAINRYYASQVGRFTTPDPWGGADPGVPQSWNKFAYVGGDPVNFVDPPGLYFQCGSEEYPHCPMGPDPTKSGGLNGSGASRTTRSAGGGGPANPGVMVALNGLRTIADGKFREKEPCSHFFQALITVSNLKTDVNTLMGQVISAATEAASNSSVYDGPSSSTLLTSDKFPNAATLGITTVGGWFALDIRREAISQVNGSAVFIRTNKWSGWLSPYASGSKASPYGLGTLMHELLHKQAVGGGFSHDIMDDALREIGRNPTDFSGQNGKSRELGSICFF